MTALARPCLAVGVVFLGLPLSAGCNKCGGTTPAGGTSASSGTTTAGATNTAGETIAKDAGRSRAPTWGGTARSCNGLAATCGPSGNDDCCKSLLVPGGTFDRGYDGVDYLDPNYPATVSDFCLDKYEITVGRFRVFVNAGMGTQESPPGDGTGAHPLIAGSGWNAAWNTKPPAKTAALKTALLRQRDRRHLPSLPGRQLRRHHHDPPIGDPPHLLPGIPRQHRVALRQESLTDEGRTFGNRPSRACALMVRARSRTSPVGFWLGRPGSGSFSPI